MNCICGPQQYTHEVEGGLAISGEATQSTLILRGEGGLCIKETALYDISNRFSFGYQHLLHLQENGSPYDNDGTGNDGTTSLAPSRVKGLFGGYAQEFTGTQWIDINSDTIDNSKPWTFSAWVNIQSFYRQAYLFRFGENKIWWNVLNQFQFSTLFNGDTNNTWATSRVVNDDKCWHHCCIVYRPAESIEVWVDGEKEKEITIDKNLPTSSLSSIGRDKNEQRKAEAYIQEIRLKYGAMGEAQIVYEYENGCGRDHISIGTWETP